MLRSRDVDFQAKSSGEMQFVFKLNDLIFFAKFRKRMGSAYMSRDVNFPTVFRLRNVGCVKSIFSQYLTGNAKTDRWTDKQNVGIRGFCYKAFHALEVILREITNQGLELDNIRALFLNG